MAANAGKSKSLRVLALHGHFQSGEIFAKKTGALKKILTSLGVAYVHYPTAPHKLEQKNDDGEDVYSWFKWEPADRWWAPESYIGVEESVALLKKEFYEHGPFDGVIGFSQGGVMLSMLTGMREPRGAATGAISFDFAIFAATFPPAVADWFYYTLKSNKCAPLDSLHVYGAADPLVVPERSHKLAEEYETQAATEPTAESSEVHQSDVRVYKTTVMRLEHPGGHFVPTNAPAKKIYKEFFEAIAKNSGSN